MKHSIENVNITLCLEYKTYFNVFMLHSNHSHGKDSEQLYL